MSSVSIRHSDYLHLRLNVIVASTFSIECLWLLVSISVFPVGDFFSNKEIHTFSHICANQSASETFNTSLWRRKTKPASVNYFVIVVLATDKTCGTYPWQVSNFSLLLNIMFWKRLFITMLERTCLPSWLKAQTFRYTTDYNYVKEETEKGGYFDISMSSEIISFVMITVDMYSKRITYGSLLNMPLMCDLCKSEQGQGCSANKKDVGTHTENLAILKQL